MRPAGTERAQAVPAATPRVRIVALTNLSGYLEPCGCQSRPLGGVDKAAAVLRELAADRVPTLMLAAGDLFFEPAGSGHGGSDEHASEAKTQHLWQAEALADVLKQLGLAAATPGPADTRYGEEQLAALQARAGVTLLDALPAQRVLLERGAMRIGAFGLRQDALDAPSADGTAIASEQVSALRAQGAQLVIGLLQADARAARRIAGSVRGMDFLLVGGHASGPVPPPERIGETTLLHAGKHGHGLLVVDVYGARAAPEKPLEDVSGWTRKAQAEALHARAEELAGRIATWKSAAGTDPKLLAEQEQRLAALRAEHAAAARGKPPHAQAFSARFIELGPEITGDAELRRVLAAHDKRVNEHNRVALAHLTRLPVAQGMPTYMGSELCGTCHEAEFAWWRGHAHGQAYATLVERDKQFSLSCVGCHVTGYGQPGGATVTDHTGLVDVGCESCHGPGSLHAEDRDTDDDKNVKLQAPESVCVQCHNEEHSDQFEYAKYKEKLMAPGHGLPLAAAPAPEQR